MHNTVKQYSYHKHGRDIVHRWENNPVISIDNLGFKCADIHNAGVAQFNNQILMLITIENLAGQKCLHLAKPTNAHTYSVCSEPLISPTNDQSDKQHESRGIMEARITLINDTYYIMYTAQGEHGYRLGLASTRDFKAVKRIGLISQPDTKAGALFPVKINGCYVRLERPCECGSIWISYSQDLIYWGKSELIMQPRPGYWDASRIGTAGPPIEIEQGWLLIYYAAKDTSAGPIYRLGAAILDKNNPAKVLIRANIPILSPRETYERIGDVPNIVYSTGAVVEDNKNLKIIYGAANSCICFGKASIEDIVINCLESKKEF